MTALTDADDARTALLRRLQVERHTPIPHVEPDPLRDLIHLIATELGMAPKAAGMTREALIEDVEFMRATGESPAGVARRLGQTQATIARRLWRAGRDDLARFMEARTETAA